jgi:hypothetical protein
MRHECGHGLGSGLAGAPGASTPGATGPVFTARGPTCWDRATLALAVESGKPRRTALRAGFCRVLRRSVGPGRVRGRIAPERRHTAQPVIRPPERGRGRGEQNRGGVPNP